MGDVATYTIELGVGVASLGLAVFAWRRGGTVFATVALVLAAAGAAAVVHALSRLL